MVVEPEQRTGIRVFARPGARVVAVNDGRVTNIGRTKRLGRFIRLRDVYGNTYTYAHLDQLTKRYPSPKPQKATPEQIADELQLPRRDARPAQAASTTG